MPQPARRGHPTLFPKKDRPVRGIISNEAAQLFESARVKLQVLSGSHRIPSDSDTLEFVLIGATEAKRQLKSA